MQTLSLTLIVRNEEKNLQRLLETIVGVFDEMIIVDTGSTDNTKKIAHQYGVKGFTHVHDFKWIDDFAAARNFAFSKTTGQYVMWLDADDIILPEDRLKLLELKKNLGQVDAYLMAYNYAQDEYGNCLVNLFRHRIIRRGTAIWQYPIHECMGFKEGYTELVTDITVTHRRENKDAAIDKGRNIRILRNAVKKQPDDIRLKFYLAKELYSEGLHQECIDSFNEYFKLDDWHDNRINGHWYQAMSYLALGKEQEATETCMRAIALDPRFAEFYVIIGCLHYSKEQWAKAIPWFVLATKCDIPKTPGTTILDNYTWTPHDRLCKCYSQVGEVYKAYEHNEKALRYRPNEPRFLFNREFLRNTLFPGRQAEQPIRLSLGSGSKFTPTYKNCDLFPEPGVVELFDQSDIPYPNSSVHAIHSEHALEHAKSHNVALATLTEWARVMRHGGSLVLKLPDLEQCCEKYLTTPDKEILTLRDMFGSKEWYKYTLYGIQDKSGLKFPEGQYHRTGFCKPEIERLLTQNGFKVESITNYDGYFTPSMEVHATQKRQSIKVRWLVPNSILDTDYASFRLRQLNIHAWLEKNGVDSKLVMDYLKRPFAEIIDELRYADVVVFNSHGPTERALIDKLRRRGIAVIHDHCEDLHGLPDQDESFGAASIITCCSTVLAEKAKHYNRVVVLPDAYEVPSVSVNHDYHKPHGKDGKLRVTWCGMGGNMANSDAIRPICEKLGMEMRTISEWPNADLKWNSKTWLNDLADTDIVISPQRHWLQPAKSNTKVTQAMSLGLPVLASPIRSYTEAIQHGVNGFICSTPEEWERDLIICQDATVRERIGKAAQESAKSYSVESIGQRWIELLSMLAHENCSPPKVDIVIPTWNNLPYLQECIKSIRANTTWPYNIIIVNSGTDGTEEWIKTQQDIISYHSPRRLHFSEANNIGLKIGKERFVCLLNDDTIVSKYWLTAMMQEAMKPEIGAVNPFSNCDMGWLHNETVMVGGIALHPGMKYEQVANVITQIYEYSHPKVVTERDWVPFFATVIPRHVIDKVGLLDEGFKSGCEDSDLCIRIRQAGYRTVTTDDSWVFHFGGTTRKNSEKVGHKAHHEEDAANHALFRQKYGDGKPIVVPATPPTPPTPAAAKPPASWGSPAPIATAAATAAKPIFCLFTGPAWEKWGPKSLDEGGIGGSETCAIYVAREFAKRGYQSFVFAECDEGIYDGVSYQDFRKIPQFLATNEIDIFISSRRPDVFALPMRAKHKVCWVHDIWLSNNRGENIYQNVVDKYFCLSPWHRDFFSNHHNVPLNKIFVTRNGIDLDRFKEAQPRDRARMIYTSSPDRGLDILLDALPKIRKHIPQANLQVFYGFKNWEEAVKVRKNQQEIAWMERLKHQLKQPGVTYHGRIGQRQLAQEFMKSELWAYPTYFTETFCITAIEAMAAGLPLITTNLAALSTTVGETGVLLNGDPRSEAYQNQFVHEVVSMLTDWNKWQQHSAKSQQRAVGYTWDTIVDEWLGALK